MIHFAVESDFDTQLSQIAGEFLFSLKRSYSSVGHGMGIGLFDGSACA